MKCISSIFIAQCGKTTLLKCLVKNFAHQRLNHPAGPVTVVSGKKRRITFVECNNDIYSMIDVAKIADLVLLIIGTVVTCRLIEPMAL